MAKRRYRRGRKSSSGSSNQKHKSSGWKRKFLLYPFLLALVVSSIFVVILDFQIRTQFEGKRWAVPARVYARPLEMFEGKTIARDALLYELTRLNYKFSENPVEQGSYFISGNTIEIYTRRFKFWDSEESPQRIKVILKANVIDAILDAKSGQKVSQVIRLDPVLIAKIYPSHNEDRILIKLPGKNATAEEKKKYALVIKVLMAVEDRNFENHWGVSPTGIVRAMWTNFRAGRTVQGGSTLTQQLVKNYFLNNRRNIWRKIKEAVMAVLLEVHYKKSDIMEAYLNEVYLGQDGRRAIHGFGLASQFYFNRDLHQLDLHQVALLVGMVKGPSYYRPTRYPDRAVRRRSVVLSVLHKLKVITQEEMLTAKQQPLGIEKKSREMKQKYPAFVDLLRRQLGRDYSKEDLIKGGLIIHTTLDPIVQNYAEQAMTSWTKKLSLSKGLGKLQKKLCAKKKTDDQKRKCLKRRYLQGSIIVTTAINGEVTAIVGDSNVKFPGFNRALDAKRQIGSLIKPVAYLAALTTRRYTLATLLDDSVFEYKDPDNGKIWAPKNYDKLYHGNVPFYKSLSHSYNVSTVRLGMDVGLPLVIETLNKLGFKRKIRPLPSMLLGAVNMTPLEVTQIYQTFASQGYHIPLKTIRAIMNSSGKKIQSYPLQFDRVFKPVPVYLLNVAMQQVISNGTGRLMSSHLPAYFNIAGKTGTTDDKVDSWFAGFSGKHLAVVWLGNDENKTIHLTGSSGALRVWGEMMSKINTLPLNLKPQEAWKMEFHWIDPNTGLRTSKGCEGAVQLPFVSGTAPTDESSCKGKLFRWF